MTSSDTSITSILPVLIAPPSTELHRLIHLRIALASVTAAVALRLFTYGAVDMSSANGMAFETPRNKREYNRPANYS